MIVLFIVNVTAEAETWDSTKRSSRSGWQLVYTVFTRSLNLSETANMQVPVKFASEYPWLPESTMDSTMMYLTTIFLPVGHRRDLGPGLIIVPRRLALTRRDHRSHLSHTITNSCRQDNISAQNFTPHTYFSHQQSTCIITSLYVLITSGSVFPSPNGRYIYWVALSFSNVDGGRCQ